MASRTQETEFRRKRRHKNMNKPRKRRQENEGTTPAFPVHTAEADTNAPQQARKVREAS